MIINQERRNKGWNDIGFAIGFYISMVINITFALYGHLKYGHKLYHISFDAIKGVKIDSVHFNTNDILFIILSIIGAMIFCFLWILLLSICSKAIIKICLVLNCVMLCIAASLSFIFLGSNGYIGSILLLLLAVFNIIWVWWVWKYIPFADALLSVAMNAFKKCWSPIGIHLFMGIVAVEQYINMCQIYVRNVFNLFF